MKVATYWLVGGILVLGLAYWVSRIYSPLALATMPSREKAVVEGQAVWLARYVNVLPNGTIHDLVKAIGDEEHVAINESDWQLVGVPGKRTGNPHSRLIVGIKMIDGKIPVINEDTSIGWAPP